MSSPCETSDEEFKTPEKQLRSTGGQVVEIEVKGSLDTGLEGTSSQDPLPVVSDIKEWLAFEGEDSLSGISRLFEGQESIPGDMDDSLKTAFRIKPFDGTGFPIWKFTVKTMLEVGGLLGVVDGSTRRPYDPTQRAAWDVLDGKARGLLVTSLDQSQVVQVMNCKTANEMWTRMESIHEQKSSASKSILKGQFYEFKMDTSKGMAANIADLESLVAQLEAVGVTTEDDDFTAKVISSLPSSYRHFVSAWHLKDEDSKSKERLLASLLQEETASKKFDEEDQPETAFNVNRKRTQFKNTISRSGGNHGKGSESEGQSGSRRNDKKCFKCGMSGHFKRDCKSNTNGSGQKDDKKQSLGGKRNKTALTASSYVHAMLSRKNSRVWIIDSGASSHMTNNRDWIEDYISDETQVSIADGSFVTSEGHGNVSLEAVVDGKTSEVILEDVLYVPSFKCSLMSIASTTSLGNKVVFYDDQVRVTNRGIVIASGSRDRNDLYQLNLRVNSQACLASSSTASLTVWHQRLGHVNKSYINEMVKKGSVNGLKISGGMNSSQEFCQGCVLSKQTRASFKSINRTRKSEPGHLIHGDICGPINVTSCSGYKYFFLLKDDCSDFRVVYFLKNKSDIKKRMKEYIILVNHDLKDGVKFTLRSDNRTEFTNQEFKDLLRENGWRHELTTPYSPEQNGVVERDNRTVLECSGSLLHSKSLPKKYWAEAVNTAVYLLNRTTNKRLKGLTPHELWYGTKPDVSHLRVFGSEVYVQIPSLFRKKLDVKANKRLLVGYNANKSYRLLDPETDTVSSSCSVVFDEDDGQDMEDIFLLESISDSNVKTKGETASEPQEVSESETESEGDDTVESERNDKVTVRQSNASQDEQSETQDEQPKTKRKYTQRGLKWKDLNVLPPSSMTRRSHAEHNSMAYAFMVYSSVMEEPASYEDAVTGHEKEKWIDAMNEEMSSLHENQTWILEPLPSGRKPISCKWIYKKKTKADGSLDRFKARLVARGFSQRPGIDYNETFSPVVRFDSLRVLLSLAASQDMELLQFDIKTAFLYGHLDNDIYMSQPQGFIEGKNLVCRLKKSLYGLKQSPRQWNFKFKSFLETQGFIESSADSCVFISKTSSNPVYLCVYVDDGILMSKDKSRVDQVMKEMEIQFQVKKGTLDCFLGIEIERNREKKEIFLHQQNYIKKVIARFNMETATPVSIPMDPHVRLSKGMDGQEQVRDDQDFPFSEAIGSLMYLCVNTRPDIAFSVAKLSQFLSKPHVLHWKAVQKLLKYLKGTTNLGIRYSCQGENKDILTGFSDADYAGCIDSRCSTTGYVFFLNGGPITWQSRKQKSVSLSSCEAELQASCQATKELIWLRKLLNSLDVAQEDGTALLVDNQSTIKLIMNPVLHQRSKHINIQYKFISQQQQLGNVSVKFVPSHDQMADILTKALSHDTFKRLRGLLMDWSSSSNS